MKIIIAGAGEVGFQVAKMLANEEHDIVLIDKEEERLTYAESHIDVGTLKGNSVSLQLLERAGIDQADFVNSCHFFGRNQYYHCYYRQKNSVPNGLLYASVIQNFKKIKEK